MYYGQARMKLVVGADPAGADLGREIDGRFKDPQGGNVLADEGLGVVPRCSIVKVWQVARLTSSALQEFCCGTFHMHMVVLCTDHPK